MKLPEEPSYYKNQGFGPVYFGDIDGHKARIRWLTVTDISTFQLREVPEEIKKWNKVHSPSIETYISEFHENDNMFLISESHENMVSLNSLFANDMSNISTIHKIAITNGIIRAMIQLYSLGDGYSHGHLCPSNILVDPTDYQTVVIQDFGFHTLKTYCSMLTDYINKDHYTAPEFLIQKGKVIKKPSHKGDIYSLGMIILYLWSDTVNSSAEK